MIKDINICAKCVNFNLTFTKSSQKIFLKQYRKENTDDEINKRTVSDHILQKNDMIILLFFKQKDGN